MLPADLRNAILDAVTKKVTVTITTTGVPTNQTEFNPTETVIYSLKVTNASDGAQLKNVRVYVLTSDVNQLAIITPPSSTATAYKTATGTDTWNVGDGHTYMYLSNSKLSVLAPSESVTIPDLTVKGFTVSNPIVSAQIYADVDENWLIPTGVSGPSSAKTFNIVT
jgi:hypothetical protein